MKASSSSQQLRELHWSKELQSAFWLQSNEEEIQIHANTTHTVTHQIHSHTETQVCMHPGIKTHTKRYTHTHTHSKAHACIYIYTLTHIHITAYMPNLTRIPFALDSRNTWLYPIGQLDQLTGCCCLETLFPSQAAPFLLLCQPNESHPI